MSNFGLPPNFIMQHRHNIQGNIIKAIASPSDEKSIPISTTSNHVWFYSEVDVESSLELIQNLRDLDRALQNERYNRDLPPDFPKTPIYLHIQSGGGDVFAGFAIANSIAALSKKTPVYSIVEGLCASAATLISMSCAKRFMLPDAMMLIHQLSSFVYGTHEDFKDEMDLQTELMTKFVNFYAKNSKISDEDVKEMLKRNTWFNSDQALELGLVDALWGDNS